MLDSFLNKRETEADEFWLGHSRFQIPVRILGYKGKSESRLLAYLYERAGQISFYSASTVMIEVPVRQEKLAEQTGLSIRAVELAIPSLEVDGVIKVSRDRDPATGKLRTRIFIPLHSQTREPLISSPRIYGICKENRDLPYITCTKEGRREFRFLSSVGVQTYLAALALASKRVLMSFRLDKDDWKAETALGRKAFAAGMKECSSQKLLSYRDSILTLHDPRTGKPNVRCKAVRIEHEKPKWRFNFKDVSPDVWRIVVKRLLSRFDAPESTDGWTVAGLNTLCPFCHKERGFRVSYTRSRFQCFKCDRRGGLAQMSQRLLRVTQMERVKAFISEVIEEQADKQGRAELFGNEAA